MQRKIKKIKISKDEGKDSDEKETKLSKCQERF